MPTGKTGRSVRQEKDVEVLNKGLPVLRGDVGDRLIMLHRGSVLFDISGPQKRDLTVTKLVELFHAVDDMVMTDRMLFA